MGLGVLEDNYLANVPGTVPLADVHARNARDGDSPCLDQYNNVFQSHS
jgi:hypothetical protein